MSERREEAISPIGTPAGEKSSKALALSLPATPGPRRTRIGARAAFEKGFAAGLHNGPRPFVAERYLPDFEQGYHGGAEARARLGRRA